MVKILVFQLESNRLVKLEKYCQLWNKRIQKTPQLKFTLDISTNMLNGRNFPKIKLHSCFFDMSERFKTILHQNKEVYYTFLKFVLLKCRKKNHTLKRVEIILLIKALDFLNNKHML